MRLLSVFFMATLLGTAAQADPDLIGVYFDQDAFTSILNVPAGVPFDVYVSISEPTALEIYGYEFSYDLVVPLGLESSLVRLSVNLPNQALNLGDDSNMLHGEYIVGVANPLPAAPAVTCLHWQFMLTQFMPVYFALGPIRHESLDDGMPAYEGGGVLLPLLVNATVGEPSPVIGGGTSGGYSACLNFCAVPVNVQTFGQIKALYR